MVAEIATNGQVYQSTVTVSVDELPLGVQLRFPIFDENGLLLLAEHSIVTERFKRLLHRRNVTEVRILDDDVCHVKKDPQPSSSWDERSNPLEIVLSFGRPPDPESLYVANRGTPFKELRKEHASTPCDTDFYETLVERELDRRRDLRARMQQAFSSPAKGAFALRQVDAAMCDLATDTEIALLAALEVNSGVELENHCRKLSVLSMALGAELGLNEDNVWNIGVAGLLHDWGMFKIPERIRNANRSLSYVEFLEIQKHPAYSLEMLQRMPCVPRIVSVASYQVHERPDGSGYPCGKSGDEIHLLARILQVADTFLAMTAPRPYRDPLMPIAAVELLLNQAADGMADSHAVTALLRVISLFPIGSYVELTDGALARVIRSNGANYAQPIVEVVPRSDELRERTGESVTVDLAHSDIEITNAVPTPGESQIRLSPTWDTISLPALHDVGTDGLKQAASRVLNDLDTQQSATQNCAANKRVHPRTPLRQLLKITTLRDSADKRSGSREDDRQVWARNVSCGGLSFIHFGELDSKQLLIHLGEQEGDSGWIEARVVRCQPVAEGFWEYGVAFLGRR